jgi:glycosyltransferase involved in cell wall biosynthesis
MDNNSSLVTIVALCYNQGEYVIETLESIKNQTYSNIQLIIIDNGSSDDSQIKIQKWIESSGILGVEYFPQEKNLGVCAALNKALSLTKGKYYQFVACDDILLQDKISKQVEIFENLPESVSFIYGNFKYINEKGEILNTPSHFEHHGWVNNSDLPSGRIKSSLLTNYFICAPSLLYRTNCVKTIGGYDETIPFEDFQMNIRLLAKYSCTGIVDTLCLYRVLSTSFYNTTSGINVERNYLHTMKYIYGENSYQNWIIILRYIISKNSFIYKFFKYIIFSLLKISANAYKKEYGV